MAIISANQLADLAALTRATEYRQGGFVALTEPLPEYVLFDTVLTRRTIRSTPNIRYQIIKDKPESFETSWVGKPIELTVPKHAETATLNWAKKRTSVAWYADEEAFNGVGADQIIDVVMTRKILHDAEMRQNYETALAGGVDTSLTVPDQIGLKDWFPRQAVSGFSTGVNLEMNGGSDPASFSSGIGGVAVADTPRWAHAVGRFSAITDQDLLKTLSVFMHRSKYTVPAGANVIDPTSPRRLGLCNSEVFTKWEALQVAANDNPGRDIGMWRGAIDFRSSPFVILHAQSEPDSAETPSDHCLLYLLDLGTLEFWIHSDYNFKLSEVKEIPLVPGGFYMTREVYSQLACLNREKNLVMTSEESEFIIS